MAAVAQPANTKYIHNGSSNGNGNSPSTPWSYANFQSFAASGALATNTAYKFLEGRYEGQLTISGVVATQSTPIVLEPHDEGEVVFTGSRDVNTGWTWDNTVSCWKTTDLPSDLTHIHNLYDGANGPHELKQLAQRNNNGFYQPQALFPGSGTLVDPALPLASAEDLTGARILYRYANWGYAYAVVTDHDVNASNQPRLHFPTVVSSDTWNGTWGYNLLDRLDFLDAPGEWFHDRMAQPNVLYYNNGSSSTSPTAIRVSSNIQNWGVLMNKLQPGSMANEWVTIRGLRFEHFDDELYPPILDSQYIIDSYRNNSANYPRGTGIRIDRGLHKNITIEHCVFSDLRFGIENFMPAEYARDMSYLDNTFQRVYSNAIRCGIYDARIERNTFLDIARVPGQAFSDFGFNVALIVASDGFVVRHNRFIGLGGSGIAVGPVAQVSGGPEANLVEHNYLNPGLLTLNDHGAITFDKCESVLIRENIVVDMEGNSETSAGGDFQKDRTVGIYTGYVAPVKNVNLVRNIVTGVGTGINVDHAPEHANNTYSGNTVFACRGAQLNLFDGGIPGGNQYEPAFSSNFHGNILYCTKAEQHPVDILQVKALAWQGGSRPRVDFGSFNGNFYFNPFSDITHYMGFFRDDFSGVGNYVGSLAQPRDVPFTLQSWRALVEPTDASTRSPLRLKDYAVLGNPAVVATHSTECTPADATWSNADALPGDGSVDGHYKRFVDLNFCERWAGSGFPGVTAVTTGSATPPGELYRITFSARSNTTDAIRLAPLVNVNSLAIDPSTYVSLTQDWSQQEALINLTGPNSADRFAISFQNAQRGMGALSGSTTVDIDHVRTDIVTLDPDYYASEVEPNHILRFNCPLPGTEHVMNAGASFTVPGDPGQCWSDVHGNFYAAGDEITLDEWASIILFRMDVPDAN
ncbi:MAG TPA: hypothetical protein PKY96_13330, partial [Flavobacteriales bacterium]|nr:hypothetical protein [Flavobacteriales bacterium]